MASTQEQFQVIRSSRGLTLSGTRITLYALVEYLKAGWSPTLIRAWLNISEQQMDAALDFISSHSEGVEQEYQQILQEAQSNRHYWESLNQDLLNSPSPLEAQGTALYAKLQQWKHRLTQDPSELDLGGSIFHRCSHPSGSGSSLKFGVG